MKDRIVTLETFDWLFLREKIEPYDIEDVIDDEVITFTVNHAYHRMVSDHDLRIAVHRAYEIGKQVGRDTSGVTEPHIGVLSSATNNLQVDLPDNQVGIIGTSQLRLIFASDADAMIYKLANG